MVLLHVNHTLRMPKTLCPLLCLSLHHVSCDVKQCPASTCCMLSSYCALLFSLLALLSHGCVCHPPVVCLLRTSCSVLLLQWALPHCSRLGCDPRTWVFMNESLCQFYDSSKAYWNFTFNTELSTDLDVSTKLTTHRYPEFLKTSMLI